MSRVSIIEPSLRDATFVAANARPMDVKECRCQIPERMKMEELAYLLLVGGDSFIVCHNGVPALFAGTSPMTPGCLSAWAIGTKHAWRTIHAATRHFITDHLPRRMAEGYLAMEARSIVDHRQAHDWMRSTGAVVHGEPFVYGRDGEKFLLFRWSPEAIDAAGRRYRTGRDDGRADQG